MQQIDQNSGSGRQDKSASSDPFDLSDLNLTPETRTPLSNSMIAKLSALVLATAGTGCESTRLTPPIPESARPLYPEIQQMHLHENEASRTNNIQRASPRALIIPGESLKDVELDKFTEMVTKLQESIRADTPGIEVEICQRSSSKDVAELIRARPKTDKTSVYVVDKVGKWRSNELEIRQLAYHASESENLRTGHYQSQYMIPDRKTPERIANKFRVFASDGAFFQKQTLSASSWLNGLNHELERSVQGLDIDLYCLVYSERRGIRESASDFCKKIIEQLKEEPLAKDEEIALFGHSQGAFILCYMLKQHETDPDYFPEFPWDKVCGLITVDLPFNTVEGYDGKLESLKDFLLSWNSVDPVLLPLLVEAIYPAGHDYVPGSKALEKIKHPAKLEIRNMRVDQNGDPVYIGEAGWKVDNPDSQWHHHPFMEYSLYREADRELRTELIVQYVRMLGLMQKLEHYE